MKIFRKSISLTDKFNFYEYLSVMLDGGVGMGETLNSVSTKIQNSYFKEKLKEIETYVSSGDSLSRSFKKVPQIFSAGEVSMIESGEATGKLSDSLDRLSQNLRKSHDLRSKVKGALTYPIIIFSFLFLAIVIVLVFVIPSISKLFDSTDVALPLATQMLIATSNFMIYNWPILILFGAGALLAFYWYKSTDSGRANIEQFLLGMPLVGKVYKNYLLASFATNLGNLVGSGVPIVQSLALSSKSLNNITYESIVTQVQKRVSSGEKIVESMGNVDEHHDYFPLDYLQMLSVGEKTASLEKVSDKLANQYTREVNYSLASLTKWIEPLAILISGVFVLWFAFAIFGAILKVTQTVS